MTLGNNHEKTAKALAESEKLYRLLVENSTEIISKHTPEGVYTYASPACRSLLGYEPEELVGRSAYEFFYPEDLEQIRRTHSARLDQPDVYTLSYRIRRKDGSYAWFETIYHTVSDPDTSEVLEIIAVSRDITEHKRTEEALRESQEELRKSEESHRFAAEAGRIGTWDLDLQAEECLLSPKMTELMGFSPDQTIVPGPQWREAIVPEDRTLMASALAASIESDAPFDLEFRVALKDGTERWLYSRGGVSRDASGKALRVHGASIDVTERKQAEENLRQSEERLRRAIEIETVGVIFFRTDGSITDANDAFLRMSGYSREDLVEGLVRWDEMTPPEWMPHSLKAIEELESTGRTIPYEKEYIRKDDTRWWALFAATRLDEEESVEFIIDITESKRAEENLRRSNRQIVNILESITDAFFAVDQQWRFTYVNRRAEQVLERSREELLGRNLWEEFPEAVGSTFDEKYRKAAQLGTPVYFEEFYVPLGIWVEVHAYPYEEGLAVYFQDITERKQAEEELRFRRALLEAQTETSIDGILIASTDGEMISYNERFVEMWDMPEEVLTTRSDEAAIKVAKDKVADPQEFMTRVNYLYEHPDEESREEILLKDGRTFDRYSAPVTGADGTHYGRVWYFRDITRRKRAEESLLEIREAERRRIARELHDAVLQDLSSTLQGLQAVQVEFDSADWRADLRRETEALRRAVRGLRDAVHDLRHEKEQPFVKAVESLVEYNRQLTPERQMRLNVQESFPQELPEQLKVELLRVVREALTIALCTAVDPPTRRFGYGKNERRPSIRGGAAQPSLRRGFNTTAYRCNARRHSEARWIGVRLRKNQDEVCVEIIDDGLGFDPESVRRGLGLLGMWERIETFGGELEVRSEVGEGTMVSVTVPAQTLADEKED